MVINNQNKISFFYIFPKYLRRGMSPVRKNPKYLKNNIKICKFTFVKKYYVTNFIVRMILLV